MTSLTRTQFVRFNSFSLAPEGPSTICLTPVSCILMKYEQQSENHKTSVGELHKQRNQQHHLWSEQNFQGLMSNFPCCLPYNSRSKPVSFTENIISHLNNEAQHLPSSFSSSLRKSTTFENSILAVRRKFVSMDLVIRPSLSRVSYCSVVEHLK